MRERLEQNERLIYQSRAFFSVNTRGRAHEDDLSPTRTCFMRDCDRIIHSKAFRRLKHKTQMFISPDGDHYRTRLTHTLEVAQISRAIARGLGLNEYLTEAVALGHDLGHTPFGHAGEDALGEVCPHGFSHSAQSVRICERVEKDGRGLNLCYEVLDGMRGHTGAHLPGTLEGRIVRLADRVAYLNHDIDDAIRAGALAQRDIPQPITEVLGGSHSARINTLVSAMIDYGEQTGEIGLFAPYDQALESLRDYMFKTVYKSPAARDEEQKGKGILIALYRHFAEQPERLPEEFRLILARDGVPYAVCDYVSGMTDRYAIAVFNQLFIPKSWNNDL